VFISNIESPDFLANLLVLYTFQASGDALILVVEEEYTFQVSEWGRYRLLQIRHDDVLSSVC
jgi:hypothetical protein